MAHPTTGDTTSGSAVITALSDTTDLAVGMEITCANFPVGTLISSVDGATQITADTNSTATSTGVSMTFHSAFASVTEASGILEANLNPMSGMAAVLTAAAVLTSNLTLDVELACDMQATATLTAPAPTERYTLLNSELTATGSFPSTGVAINLQPELACEMTASSVVTVDLVNDIALTPLPLTATATTTACLDKGMYGIGVCHVVRDIMRLWGIEDASISLPQIRERAINDLNMAMQTLWSNAPDKDYWTRTTETLSFIAGTPTLVLDNTIQNVLGSARLSTNKKPLIALTSMGEVENYDIYYGGGLTHAASSGEIAAYFVERTSQTGSDPAKATVHVAPTPSANTDVLLDVVKEAPRYTWTDYKNCTELPIPHQYVESLLLPLCRFKASSYRLFVNSGDKDSIIQEYRMAMNQLGLNDPLTVTEESRKENS